VFSRHVLHRRVCGVFTSWVVVHRLVVCCIIVHAGWYIRVLRRRAVHPRLLCHVLGHRTRSCHFLSRSEGEAAGTHWTCQKSRSTSLPSTASAGVSAQGWRGCHWQTETLILTREAQGSAGPVPRKFQEATSGAGPGGEGYGGCMFTLITHTLVDLDFLRMKLTQFGLQSLKGEVQVVLTCQIMESAGGL
jgi:hypothetical protein